MKTLHFVSILALAATATFACSDDDAVTPGASAGASGSSGSAGKNGTAGGNSSAGKSNGTGGKGTAGSSTGGTSTGGTSTGGTSTGGTSTGGTNTAGTNTAGTSTGGTSTGGTSTGGTSATDGGMGGGGNGGENQGGSGDAGGEGGVPGELGGWNAGGAGATGAGGDGGASSAAPLEITGTWNDGFSDFEITASEWPPWGTIQAYDNATNLVYTQFPADDAYNPNKFTKAVYLEPTGGSFYYCFVVFSATTLAEAQADTSVPNPSAPEDGGCGAGDFPWSKATAK